MKKLSSKFRIIKKICKTNIIHMYIHFTLMYIIHTSIYCNILSFTRCNPRKNSKVPTRPHFSSSINSYLYATLCFFSIKELNVYCILNLHTYMYTYTYTCIYIYCNREVGLCSIFRDTKYETKIMFFK